MSDDTYSSQDLRAEAFKTGEDVAEGSPSVLARPSQEHLDAAAKFQLALQRQRSGQLPTTSGPAAAAPSSQLFPSRHSPTIKLEVRCQPIDCPPAHSIASYHAQHHSFGGLAWPAHRHACADMD